MKYFSLLFIAILVNTTTFADIYDVPHGVITDTDYPYKLVILKKAQHVIDELEKDKAKIKILDPEMLLGIWYQAKSLKAKKIEKGRLKEFEAANPRPKQINGIDVDAGQNLEFFPDPNKSGKIICTGRSRSKFGIRRISSDGRVSRLDRHSTGWMSEYVGVMDLISEKQSKKFQYLCVGNGQTRLVCINFIDENTIRVVTVPGSMLDEEAPFDDIYLRQPVINDEVKNFDQTMLLGSWHYAFCEEKEIHFMEDEETKNKLQCQAALLAANGIKLTPIVNKIYFKAKLSDAQYNRTITPIVSKINDKVVDTCFFLDELDCEKSSMYIRFIDKDTFQMFFYINEKKNLPFLYKCRVSHKRSQYWYPVGIYQRIKED